jgi:hypothetical protein
LKIPKYFRYIVRYHNTTVLHVIFHVNSAHRLGIDVTPLRVYVAGSDKYVVGARCTIADIFNEHDGNGTRRSCVRLMATRVGRLFDRSATRQIITVTKREADMAPKVRKVTSITKNGYVVLHREGASVSTVRTPSGHFVTVVGKVTTDNVVDFITEAGKTLK